jgi:hypothetical protein
VTVTDSVRIDVSATGLDVVHTVVEETSVTFTVSLSSKGISSKWRMCLGKVVVDVLVVSVTAREPVILVTKVVAGEVASLEVKVEVSILGVESCCTTVVVVVSTVPRVAVPVSNVSLVIEVVFVAFSSNMTKLRSSRLISGYSSKLRIDLD